MENLSNGTFRLGLATVSQLALHPDFSEELASMIRREGGPDRAIAALNREFFGAVEEEDAITIPATATPEALIADAKDAFTRVGIPVTYFDKDVLALIKRDLPLVKGKTLKALTHSFGRSWTTQEGRDLQQGQGFDGNAAAFLVWVVQTKRMGWSVSIPNTDDRLFRDGGRLYASCFYRDESRREFSLRGVGGGWGEVSLLVAFRAI